MTYRTATRIGLGYLFIGAVMVGLWGALFPRSFYDDFPGWGRAWISVDGPYNEHFIRDIGALNLALAVLLCAAFVLPTRHLVTAAAGASLAWGVPHFLYHALNTDALGAADNVLNLTSLATAAALPLLLLWAAPRLELDQPHRPPPAG